MFWRGWLTMLIFLAKMTDKMARARRPSVPSCLLTRSLLNRGRARVVPCCAVRVDPFT